jgi:hypothetical protein
MGDRRDRVALRRDPGIYASPFSLAAVVLATQPPVATSGGGWVLQLPTH